TDGQVLIGSSTGDPAFATISSITGTLTFVIGHNSLSIDLKAPVPIAYGGTNTTTFGTTTSSVLYFDGNKLNSISAGTIGQVLVSSGPGVVPAFQTFGGTISFLDLEGTITVTPPTAIFKVGTNFVITGPTTSASLYDVLISSNFTATPGNTYNNVYGIDVAPTVTTSGSGAVINYTGIKSEGNLALSGTGTATVNAYGLQIAGTFGSTSGTSITNVYGENITPSITASGTGSIGSIFGTYIRVTSTAGNGTATSNAFGLYIDTTRVQNTTNAYGLYVNTPTGASTTNISGYFSTAPVFGTPLGIASGGSNNTSFNSFGVLYFDGSKFNSTTSGTSGQVLTSNGPGLAPTFITPGTFNNIQLTGTITVVPPSAVLSVGTNFSTTSTSTLYAETITSSFNPQTASSYTNVFGLNIAPSIGGLGSVTNAYSLYVATMTGATNNYTAVFVGTATLVGIGTSTPINTLDVNGGVAIGSYAGVVTAPSNGLIVSGRVGIGTTTLGSNWVAISPTVNSTAITTAFNVAPVFNPSSGTLFGSQFTPAFNPTNASYTAVYGGSFAPTITTSGTGTVVTAYSLNVAGPAVTGTVSSAYSLFVTAPTGVTNSYTAYLGGNTGINNLAPINALDVSGGVAIGSFAGFVTAPTGGLIVAGIAGFGTTTPTGSQVVISPGITGTTLTSGLTVGPTYTPISGTLFGAQISPAFNPPTTRTYGSATGLAVNPTMTSSGTGTASDLYGEAISLTISASGNTVNNGYGLRISGPSISAGTLTTAYSLYVTSPSGAGTITNNYTAYIQGLTGINILTPKNMLDVGGAVAIGSFAGFVTAPTNGLIVSGIAGFGTTTPSGSQVVISPGISGAAITTGLTVGPTFTPTSGTLYGQQIVPQFNPPTGNTYTAVYGSSLAPTITAAGTGNVTTAYGQAVTFSISTSSATVNTAYSMNIAGPSISAGTIGTAYSLFVTSPGGAGTINNSYTAYFDPKVGIGNQTPVNGLDVSTTETIGFGSSPGLPAAPANGLLVRGNVGIGTTSIANGYVTISPTSTTTNQAILYASGTSNYTTTSTAGSVTFVSGAGATTGNTLTFGSTLDLQPTFTGNAGTVTNAIGLRIGTGVPGAGTITNGYALFVRNPSYGTSQYTGYFEGNVGFATLTPVNNVDVSGTVAIGTYAGSVTAPTNGLIVSGVAGFGTSAPGTSSQVTIAPTLGATARPNALLLNATFTQPSGNNYFALNNTSTFSFTGGTTTIALAAGEQNAVAFNPAATVTITNAYGLYLNPSATPAGGSVSNLYGLFVASPSGAGNNFSAFFAGTVGFGAGVSYSGDTTFLKRVMISPTLGASPPNYAFLVNPTFSITTSGTYASLFAETITPQFTGTAGVIYSNVYGLNVAVSATAGGGTVSNAYGLRVPVPTGALNNISAFLDAPVGIATTTPVNALDITGGVAIGSFAGSTTSPAPFGGLIVAGPAGFGINTPGTASQVSVSPTVTAVGFSTAVTIAPVYSPATTATLYGEQVNPKFTPPAASTYTSVYGVSIGMSVTATALTSAVTNAYGLSITPTVSTGSTGSVGNLYGAYVKPTITTSGTGTSTTAAYGIYIDNVAASSNVVSAYGLRVVAPTGATASRNYTAYFDSLVGINTPSPQNSLDVFGNVAIGTFYAGNVSAPSNGLIVSGQVGVGTTTPTVNQVAISPTVSTTAITTGLMVAPSYNPSSGTLYGEQVNPTFIASTAVTFPATYGLSVAPVSSATATGSVITNAYGLNLTPTMSTASTGTIGTAYGGYTKLTLGTTGTGAATANAYGFFIDSVTTAGGANNVTNAYGLQVNTPTVAGTTNSFNSFFSGSGQIGFATPPTVSQYMVIGPVLTSVTTSTAVLNSPTFSQAFGSTYVSFRDTPTFGFAGGGTTTISNIYGTHVIPQFSPTNTTGTLTLTNAQSLRVEGTFISPSRTAFTNVYGIFANPIASTSGSGTIQNYAAANITSGLVLTGAGTSTLNAYGLQVAGTFSSASGTSIGNVYGANISTLVQTTGTGTVNQVYGAYIDVNTNVTQAGTTTSNAFGAFIDMVSVRNTTSAYGLYVMTPAGASATNICAAFQGTIYSSAGITFDNGINTLATYVQSGTFTPTIVGSTTAGTTTYSSQLGFYTQIGTRVFVDALVTYTAATGTGNMLGNVPFTAKTGIDVYGSCMFSNVTIAGTPCGTSSRVASGTSNVFFLSYDSAAVPVFVAMDTTGTNSVAWSINYTRT
ncbi:MAG: hypothetical protein JSS32_10870, partial [Verrucomicrobia bacterium]|nr:hypothetical protein [Verrucomicrobiota bacterium]